jgi:hypothetical protein
MSFVPLPTSDAGAAVRSQIHGLNPSSSLVEEIWKDAYTGAITQIDIAHAAIHLGLYMGHSGMVTIAPGAHFDHLMKVPAGFNPAVHMRVFQVRTTSAPLIHRFYEAPVVTVEGTLARTYNFNRNSAAPVMPIWHGPTVDLTGLYPISTAMIVGSIGTGGLGETSGTEWPLKPDTYYLSRITNDSGASADVNYNAEWYEL